MMTLDAFRQSLSAAEPPADVGPALQALWWLGKDDWTQAHKVCQAHEDDADCNWVHAHLHRQEGDLSNARHWYHTAGRAMPTNSLKEEWEALAAGFLAG
ncbi:MAG TPA: hypothetical protein VFB13_05165 [Reyranella sp.]|jgi:hypothetical protein|nr:hypothetical protein [Reyranella sp.]